MRRALLIAAAIALVASAVVVSRRTSPERIEAAAGVAPAVSSAAELPVLAPAPIPPIDATEWVDGNALTAADLRGHVVLVEFWTFACINCQHTLPSMKAWHERYTADGLIVVTVHSPEFDFEAVPANVADFVHEHDLRYPVALDPDMEIWRAWGIRAWPTIRLFDSDGQLRLQRVGEGGYDQTEAAIRTLLGVDADSPPA